MSTIKGGFRMMHKAGDLVRINPEYFARKQYDLSYSIRERGPDYVYTVKTAGEHSLTLVEETCSWTNRLDYLVPAFEEDEEVDVDLENLL